jgi:hypothetical protein
VIGDAGFKRCSGVAHHHHVGEKRNQLVALVRKGLRPLFPGCVTRKQAGIVLLQHRGAGSRRRDDEIETFEGFDHLFRDFARVGPVAGVVGRLAAAGLSHRNMYLAAGVLQQLDAGKADGRPEKIDQAGRKKSYTRLPGSLRFA